MSASLGARGDQLERLGFKAHRNQKRRNTHPGKKLVFTKGHDPNNVIIAKLSGPSLDPGFGLLASSARVRFIQRSAHGGNVMRIKLEINVVPALQVDAKRDKKMNSNGIKVKR